MLPPHPPERNSASIPHSARILPPQGGVLNVSLLLFASVYFNTFSSSDPPFHSDGTWHFKITHGGLMTFPPHPMAVHTCTALSQSHLVYCLLRSSYCWLFEIFGMLSCPLYACASSMTFLISVLAPPTAYSRLFHYLCQTFHPRMLQNWSALQLNVVQT